jgi:uncharacterized protein YndB with AHSA1/START domain
MANKSEELLITYVFDAPQRMVFEAWTDPEQLRHWYAPDGCTIEFKTIQVKSGGSFHSCVRDPVHGYCWIKGDYHEVIVPEKLVFSMILSNEKGEEVSAEVAGKPSAWPQAIITTVIFAAKGNQTAVTLHQTVAEEEAKKTGAYQSWFNMFEKLQHTLNVM